MKADKTKINSLLKTAKGQIDGILKMVDEDKYCIDISNQVMAANAILKKVNKEIIRAHMESCVKQVFEEGDIENANLKVEEVINIIDKLSK